MKFQSPSGLKLWIPHSILFIFIAAIIILGYRYYQIQKEHIRQQKCDELTAIAELKLGQVVQWREECSSTANRIFRTVVLARQVESFFNMPGAVKQRQELLTWMESFQSRGFYSDIFLVDTQGNVRLSVATQSSTPGFYAQDLIRESLNYRRVIFLNLHASEAKPHARIDLVIPLLAGDRKDSVAIGAFLVRIDPSKILFPLIQSWPIPSRSSETVLIEQQGDSIVFLNELAEGKSPELMLRLPATEKTSPAAMAVSGIEGVVEGIDSRGIPVLAWLKAIPNSSWYMVAKIDQAEIYAPIREQFTTICIIIFLLISSALSIFAVWWRNQRVKFYRKQLDAELNRQMLMRHYDYFIKYANDIILLYDQNGLILDYNDRACQTYGYTREEMLNKNIRDLQAKEMHLANESYGAQWMEQKNILFECDQHRKDGTIFNAEVSKRFYEIEGKQFYQCIIRDITERKRTENELKKNENKLKELFDSAPVGYHELDEKGNVINVNQKELNMLGFSLEEMIGWPVWEFIADREESRKKVQAKLAGILPAGKNTEQNYTRTDGTSFPVLADDLILRNEHGEITGIRTTILDITERKQAEVKILKLNRTYAILSNINKLIVRERDRQKLFKSACQIAVDDGKFRMSWIGLLNETTGAIEPVAYAGFTDDYLRTLHITVRDTPEGGWPTGIVLRGGRSVISNDIEHDPLMIPWREKALSLGYRSSAAFPLRIANKTIGAINFYASEPHFFDEEEIQLLDGLAMDISFAMESLKMEEQRKQSEIKNAEQARLLEVALDSIVVRDIDNKLLFWNKAAEKLYGWTFEEARSLDVLRLVADDGRLKYEQSMKEFMQKGEWEGELPQKTKDGRLLITYSRWTLVRDQDGKPTARLIITRDITDRVQTEEKNRLLEQQLMHAQSLESLGTLASGIAHDFNNILGIILIYASLLERTSIDKKKISDTSIAITQAVGRGKALVNQILTFAKRTDIEFEPVNVADLIRELLSMLKQTFPKVITFTEIIEPDIPFIFANHTQIHQAILNLYVNARDAMPNGGSITIKVQRQMKDQVRNKFVAANEDEYLYISVTDTGEGMDEATCRRIFDPFFTAKKQEKKGTGLGLAVVYGVVQMHHGFIDVESELGHGTTFRLYIPILLADEPKKEILPVTKLAALDGTETILLVEDEALLVETLCILLESKGYTVYAAQDGKEAVRIYEQHKHEISLVFTDLGLPGITGMDEFRLLKEINPDIKVIFASGFFGPDVKAELVSNGAKAFIQKPYGPDDIARKIREVLDRKSE